MRQLVCTCDGWNFEDNDLHDQVCALFHDVDFARGNAFWDADTCQLYLTNEEEELDDMNNPIDATLPMLEEVHDIDDIVAVVLEEMGNKVEHEFHEKCVGYIGEDIVTIFEKMSNTSGDITNEEVDKIEEWAKELHLLSDADVPPIYDCTCEIGAQLYCGACGVYKTRNGTGPWAPIYERRKHEVRMYLTGEIYGCKCKPERKFACSTCGVQKWCLDAAWSYWCAKKVDDKKFPSTGAGGGSKTSSTSQALVTSTGHGWDGWSGYGGSVTSYTPKCRHYGEMVKLPDGTEIMCSSSHKRTYADRKDGKVVTPDFGCYMYSGWEPDWFAYWLNWTDYGLPNMSMPMVDKIVEDLLWKARDGKIVEIGCMGGHGRTGTLLALMILKSSDLTGPEAAKYVWRNYCPEAIEGLKQEWYINCFKAWLSGEEMPEMPKEPHKKWEHEKLFRAGDFMCDIKDCPTVDKHLVDWLAEQKRNEEAKAKREREAAEKKAKEGKQSTPPSQAGQATSRLTSNGSQLSSVPSQSPASSTSPARPSLLGEISWDTPIPDKQGQGKWCTTARHEVLWWRREECFIDFTNRPCPYWAGDVKKFERDKLRRCSIEERDARDLEEVNDIIDQLAKGKNLVDFLEDGRVGKPIDLTTGEVIKPRVYIIPQNDKDAPAGLACPCGYKFHYPDPVRCPQCAGYVKDPVWESNPLITTSS